MKERLAEQGRPHGYEYAETFRVIKRISPPSNNAGSTAPSDSRMSR